MKKYISITPKDQFEECASDFDWSTITNESHIKFLKWTKYLEGTLTLLKATFYYYNEIYMLYTYFDLIKSKANTFLTVSNSNNCAIIVLEISKLLDDRNELSIFNYLNFCKNDNLMIFRDNNITFLNDLHNKLKEISTIFDNDFKLLRDKIYAHSDKILINNVAKIDTIMDRIKLSSIENIINGIEIILNTIWMNYRNKKLCFTFANLEDIKEILKLDISNKLKF